MPEFRSRKALVNPELRRRGIYILPNLLTTAALFAGFYAIVQAMTDRFEQAAVAIFIAMIMDGLDGRVARLTRTQSAFGAEYDSLSDMVSFGVAPALVMFEWAMRAAGHKVGLLRPITLKPFPTSIIEELSKQVKGMLVVEMNAGQMLDDVMACVQGRCPVEFYGRPGGVVPLPDEVQPEIERMVKGPLTLDGHPRERWYQRMINRN